MAGIPMCCPGVAGRSDYVGASVRSLYSIFRAATHNIELDIRNCSM